MYMVYAGRDRLNNSLLVVLPSDFLLAVGQCNNGRWESKGRFERNLLCGNVLSLTREEMEKRENFTSAATIFAASERGDGLGRRARTTLIMSVEALTTATASCILTVIWINWQRKQVATSSMLFRVFCVLCNSPGLPPPRDARACLQNRRKLCQ